MDEDDIKKEVEPPLAGDDSAPLEQDEDNTPDDDLDDYFDRELREAELELEDTPKPSAATGNEEAD